MACDSGHAYCFPRCAPRGGARPRCAGGAAWRLDPQTGLCFRLQGSAADAALRAAASKHHEDEMLVRQRAWTDDPLEPAEITRSPPACPPGAARFPPLPAGLALAAAAAPDPKLCLWCQPGDTLDMSGNRPRCLKPCPAGYDAVVLGGAGPGERGDDGGEGGDGDENGDAATADPTQQRQGAAFCVQRCRPQDGYPYGRYCVAYGDFQYPGDCGWMASCDDGRVLLQHGSGGQDETEEASAASSGGDWLSAALSGGEEDASSPAAKKASGGPETSPPFSHMWASQGVNDEAVGLSDGYGGGANPAVALGAAARAADAALLRRGGVLAAAAAAKAAKTTSPARKAPPPSSPDLAAYLDQFDRQYVRSPLYDPQAQCRCARVAGERDARPRAQYLPLARLPEPEVQTALPRCSEATSLTSNGIPSSECKYDRERGMCVCGCPAGWRAAGAGDNKSDNNGEGAVCCDPSCPEGFSACETGGRRFCATSKPLLGADACSVLSRLVPFLSPDATCGAAEAPAAAAAARAGAASPGGNDFSPRAVVSAVAASSAAPDDEAVEYPGALFGGVTSLPDGVFGGGEVGAAGARLGGAKEEDDEGASSLLAAALEKNYEVATNTPPPPMTVQEVLLMDPWAKDFAEDVGSEKEKEEKAPADNADTEPPT
jgi:hypothetical protein